MAAAIFRVPALGAAIANITVLEWVVAEGEEISTGQTVLEVETDKMTMEVPAERGGVLYKIVAEPGAETEEGRPLAVIGDASESDEAIADLVSTAYAELGAEPPASAGPAPASSNNGPGETERVPVPEPTAEPARTATATAVAPPGKVRASPVARRVAAELGVNIVSVAGSGPGGLIRKADVTAYAAQPSQAATPAAVADRDGIEVIPYTGGRRALGEGLADSYRTVPHFTMFYDIDCEALVEARASLEPAFRAETGRGLSYMPFIIKAIATAAEEVSIVNSTLAGDEIHVKREAHVGFATAVDDLIVVPVARRPATKSITEIGKELLRLTDRARRRKLEPHDVEGATITVSNVGNTDIASAFAIINQPQVAIVAVTKIVDRVVPVSGGIGVRKMMSTSYTYDHRVVQGLPGAQYAERAKSLLEDPDALRA